MPGFSPLAASISYGIACLMWFAAFRRTRRGDVLAGGAFLGGAIFPGEALLLSALHEGTAALPMLAPEGDAARIPGKDTAEAMRAGSFWGLVGAVKELTRRSLSAFSGGATVWVTGGRAEALAPHLGTETRCEPDLVAVGLHYLYRMNEK